MKKYVFRKYHESYPLLFRREKAKLLKILPKNSRVEHIGSTSVPGLGGKGIIDIMISVKKKEIRQSISKLIKKGYVHKPNAGDKEREYFEKDYRYKGKKRRVHVHLTFHGSLEFRRSVAFTLYLKSHPEAVREYVKVKKEAVKYARGEGKKYREYKGKTLKKLGRLALKEFEVNA